MGKLDTYVGKSREVSDADWFRLNATVALLPAMFKRGLSPIKLDDFIARLLRDGSHHLIVSSVTNHFDLDAEGYLDALDDDPKAAHLMERDVPLAPAEDRFVMPSDDIVEALPPEKRLVLSNRQREQTEKDKAAAKRNKYKESAQRLADVNSAYPK